jgi:predicted transcriptional regulator of viral defense system
MLDQGDRERLGRGMYRFADMSAMGNPDLVTVALKVPKGVICLISALSWYEMTSEIP